MAAPSSPGRFVGDHKDGYFWNGTSWELGDAAPSAPFGGTIINQQQAQPAPAPAPATAAAAAKRASILATIMRVESGGRNIPQSIVDDNTRKGTPAAGYFQIINPTWTGFGGDKTGYKSAIDAPYAVQLQVAQNIPISHWGPATQAALKAAGYDPQPGETLGQMLARYQEDPAATRPEDVGGITHGGAPAPAPPPGLPPGLLAGTTPPPVDPALAAAKEKEREQQAAYASLLKQGQQMMAEPEPQAAPPRAAPMGGGLLQSSSSMPMFDFTKPQPTFPDFIEMLSQQRLRRA